MLTVASPSLPTTSHPWKGRGQGHVTHFMHEGAHCPPVTTCSKFSGWEPVSLNAASPTVLHTSGTVYLTSSLATWTSMQTLSKRNSKRFITLTATRRSTWPPRLRFVILMTDTWRVKRCIIIIIIIKGQSAGAIAFWKDCLSQVRVLVTVWF